MKTTPAFSAVFLSKMRQGVLGFVALTLFSFFLPAVDVHAAERFDSELHDYLGPPQTIHNQSDPEAWAFDLTPGGLSDIESVAAACTWSPNGFPPGQCTWYSDGRAYQNGWLIKFSQSYGRDAYKWWDLVTNANKGQLGYPGDIMVFAKSSSLPYGHVAYVESTQTASKKWTVLHANWSRGTVIGTKCGYNIRRVTVEKKSNGKVSVGGSSTTYPIKGFLYRK